MRSSPSLIIYLPSLASGGAERVYVTLAPEFIKAGFRVTFLLHRAQGEWMKEVPPEVQVVTLGRNHTLACLWPLVRFLKNERPDILLSALGHNNILAICAVAIAHVNTRVVVSQHNALSAECAPGRPWKYRILPLLYRLLLPHADGIVAVSQGVADDMSRTCGIRRNRITVIYNPVITDDFAQRMEAPVTHPWLMETDKIPVFLGVGRLTAQKDFATLISAFAIVNKKYPTRLIILGDGPLRGHLMAHAKKQGVLAKISLPGFQRNPLPFMRQANALALSSRYEGFGNVLAEALSCGTPVVSTRCPYGPSEILGNGQFGELVPIGNARALAKVLLRTFERQPSAEMLKRRGREFTVQRAARNYIILLEAE